MAKKSPQQIDRETSRIDIITGWLVALGGSRDRDTFRWLD